MITFAGGSRAVFRGNGGRRVHVSYHEIWTGAMSRRVSGSPTVHQKAAPRKYIPQSRHGLHS
ncbi:MAG: hypothetical protein COZ49_03180 [Candidatus Yonathbacteria bacterium CG_4_10_14_3_um_filter_47_65]|uniref:Uncharacterized protein n=1 Tax=Candidatus Yonathbacteria bacterium CG_4_9_14_0_8_um_filter_46_47 TaxID=1975106 RepID=A0A2M8D8D0_9BACT|nr:MAG: hypothetical protein COX54_04645 [Candidatus Yonathbacteria bacterium CG23_combo_of_CG06-09_8_20_14_all_46_18]PIQ32097.1 MAG: hypothetical protein COW61_02435 [Candidatus Yonathbacteria bacterium CG17_big_fil_post_rev_8_21_14_2_50_46_19]PIX56229.1 MAG: hypothetical protein COZ49_03180 [Candidatus Yonathbacteria bacterium CG_4_10_14_3_um_filter_47_65]PIY57356.1 MAG: hypothetical protein COY99_03495 [Candidatus Yonathbacteria bacterium CG_4_10_14_0_8_um_filter_47_645]PJB83416.1 MAG: hypot